jgi:hypothetical protein
MEEEVKLPYSHIDIPGKFTPISEDFAEAVQLVASCCKRSDEGSDFLTTCFNVNPQWIEATDRLRACRWTLDTGFKSPFLMRWMTAKPVARMGVTEATQDKVWTHFRNNRDFTLSVRRYQMEYDSDGLAACLEGEGISVSFPKAMTEACKVASESTQDSTQDNLVKVEIKSGKMKLTGDGPVSGYSKRWNKIDWPYRDIEFYITPGVLIELVDKYNEMILTPRTLKIVSGSFVYAACLTLPSKSKRSEERSED